MDFIVESIKCIVIGVVEGITEWLPISSTGHMLLVDEFLKMEMSDSFKEMFFIVIQLGAILAVVLLFFKKMWPFSKDEKNYIKKDTFSLWFKVAFACIPGAVIGIAFDDLIDKHLSTPLIIATTLIIYGIWFIVIENKNKTSKPKINDLKDITYKTAMFIGLFQVLSIIPGTSRSGATIIGGLLLGVSRVVAAEFTFFLAVPVMFGYSLIKLLKFGFIFSAFEVFILLLGMAVAFITSVFAIKFLMSYIKKHDFKVFGYYRIILGLLVILFMFI